jgi:hypothetical protein
VALAAILARSLFVLEVMAQSSRVLMPLRAPLGCEPSTAPSPAGAWAAAIRVAPGADHRGRIGTPMAWATQGAAPAMQTARRLADGKDQAHDPLGLRLGLALVIAVGSPDIAPRGMMAQGTAPRLVAPPFQPPACPEGECRFAPHPTQPYQEAIGVVCRILAAIGIGQPRRKDRTAFAHLRPVLVRARPTTHLQPQDQPSMVQVDRGSHALQAHACHHPLAALAWSFSNDDDAVARPPQGDCAVHPGLWPGRGRHVLDDVLGMGLAHLPHRQSLPMIIVELRGTPSHPSRLPSWRSHRAPPADEDGGAGR